LVKLRIKTVFFLKIKLIINSCSQNNFFPRQDKKEAVIKEDLAMD